MEASLFYFVLYVTTTGFAEISQHFGQYPLQGIAANGTARSLIGIGNGLETVVADVYGGAETMTALLGCIAVVTAQLGYILLGA
jgi:hypothetical protein